MALGKTQTQVIRDYLEKLAGADDPEQRIKEFEKLSARGHSRAWKFNRDDARSFFDTHVLVYTDD